VGHSVLLCKVTQTLQHQVNGGKGSVRKDNRVCSHSVELENCWIAWVLLFWVSQLQRAGTAGV
jgi:hypothetical protein